LQICRANGRLRQPLRRQPPRLHPLRPQRAASPLAPTRVAPPNRASAATPRARPRSERRETPPTRAHQAGALLAKRQSDQAAPAIAAAAPVAAKPAPEQPAKVAEQAARVPADTPEREFERIAQLRAEGRHDEADRAFLEFRRRYPGFRITEEMLRRIERR
jgi:TolA-binding protein